MAMLVYLGYVHFIIAEVKALNSGFIVVVITITTTIAT
jgi:hypothetical protein